MGDRFDPRLTPARPDLAARYLEGKVRSARFVDGIAMQVIAPVASVSIAPAHDAEQMSQALYGERVTIYDRDDNGWAWGQLDDDGYVGWLPDAAFGAVPCAPTHKVMALRTFGFPGPTIKLPPSLTLPLGAALVVTGIENGFAVTRDFFVPAQHVGPVDAMEADFVSVAERFLDTPYLWGGKTGLGIDCSGLVQVALKACGIGCPRDSDMQRDGLGRDVPLSDLQRGDLLFWTGHVAIARDGASIVHANAHHMMTAIEPVHDALTRIKASGGELLAVKRL